MRLHRYITRTLMVLVVLAFLLSAAKDGLTRYAESRLDRPAPDRLTCAEPAP